MKRAYVTYCDVNYAAKAIAMAESLLKHSPEVALTVLCFDDTVKGIMERWFAGRIQTLPHAELARVEPRLVPLKQERSPWEYYATHKAVVMSYMLRSISDGMLLTYVDADTMFFSDPEPLFQEMNGKSIALSPHRYSPRLRKLEIYGLYNAGFGVWRQDETGRTCLGDWSEQCLAWCSQKTTPDGRFMNQGYLTDWPGRYAGVQVLSHPGVNLAPWNLERHRLELNAGGVAVDGEPLIFFHFSSIVHGPGNRWRTVYPKRILNKRPVLDGIYRPYLARLDAISTELQSQHGVTGLETVRKYKERRLLFDIGAALEGRYTLRGMLAHWLRLGRNG